MVLGDLINDYGVTPKSRDAQGFVTLDPDQHTTPKIANQQSVEKIRLHEDTPGFKRKSIDTNAESSLQRSSGLKITTSSQ